ncbi:MAG: hypothetical protein HYY84_15370 [Deltaproteobacteria bacterium]|nr:hypothetical protein [Deltaproteobacteria bacterium]
MTTKQSLKVRIRKHVGAVAIELGVLCRACQDSDLMRARVNMCVLLWIAALLVAAACGKKSAAPSEGTVVAQGTVTPADGGVLTTSDNALTLTIPPGAVSTSTNISIRTIAKAAAVGGMAYDLQPSGLAFNVPATVRFALPEASLRGPDGGVVMSFPRLTNATGTTESLGDASVTVRLRADAGVVVSGAVNHFSDAWALLSPLILDGTSLASELAVGASTLGGVSILSQIAFVNDGNNISTPNLALGSLSVTTSSVILAVSNIIRPAGSVLEPGDVAAFSFTIACVDIGEATWKATLRVTFDTSATPAGFPFVGEQTLEWENFIKCVSNADGGETPEEDAGTDAGGGAAGDGGSTADGGGGDAGVVFSGSVCGSTTDPVGDITTSGVGPDAGDPRMIDMLGVKTIKSGSTYQFQFDLAIPPVQTAPSDVTNIEWDVILAKSAGDAPAPSDPMVRQCVTPAGKCPMKFYPANSSDSHSVINGGDATFDGGTLTLTVPASVLDPSGPYVNVFFSAILDSNNRTVFDALAAPVTACNP